MPLLHGHGAALRCVKLHSAGGDALRARQRLERALADVDWSPPELGPQALLFVRHLVADGRRGVRPASEGGAFGVGVSAALRERVRTARRPWLHADAAEAQAVCFADEAELVACLLRDWAHGAVGQRWWWQGVLGQVEVTRWLRVHAFAHGERLVPALALLAERGEAVACVARIDEADAVQARRAVQRAFGLGDSVSAAEPQQGAVSEAAAVSPFSATTRQFEAPVGPWRAVRQLMAVVPELKSPQLGPEPRRLLALALALVRAPGWARTSQLAVAVEAIKSSQSLELAVPASAPLAAVLGEAAAAPAWREGEPLVQPMEQGVTSMPRQVPTRHQAETTAEVRSGMPVENGVSSETSTGGLVAPAEFDAPTGPAVVPTPSSAEPMAPELTRERGGASPRVTTPRAPVVVATSPATVRTRYGGVFYLLNAALALRVYGDFTMPRTPGLSLSPWDLLAWTGHAWFGDDFVHDPVWGLLATLSGREPGTPPGRDFVAPTRWMLDAVWLAPWGEVDALQVQASTGRLRVWHPRGFAVFDVAREPQLRPMQQARALCDGQALLRAASLARARPPIARVPRADAARWLGHWRTYLDARLCRTLGLDDREAGGVVEAPALLCRHDAVVELSAAAVDVHLALASLPLPIRYAGLDRDPGWIPAAGRSLMFRFS